jgi:hypothetical protein
MSGECAEGVGEMVRNQKVWRKVWKGIFGRNHRGELGIGRGGWGECQNCFCGGVVGKFMGGWLEGKEEEGKVWNPIRGSTASCEGGFEAAMGSINHYIGLRMESGCVDVGNLEEGGEGGPEGGSELGTSVWGEGLGNAKTGNSCGKKSFSAWGWGNGGKGSGFKPMVGSVDHCEDVWISSGGGKGANNVDMDLGKSSFWDGDGKGWGWNMVMDFCFLTRTFFCPLIYISGHVGPNKTGGNEADDDAGMAVRMHLLKNGLLEMFVETSPRREREFVMGMEVMVGAGDFWRERMEGSVCWALATSV